MVITDPHNQAKDDIPGEPHDQQISSTGVLDDESAKEDPWKRQHGQEKGPFEGANKTCARYDRCNDGRGLKSATAKAVLTKMPFGNVTKSYKNHVPAVPKSVFQYRLMIRRYGGFRRIAFL